VSLLHAEIATVRAQLDGLAAEAGARRITPRQLAIASEPLNTDLEDLQAASRSRAGRPFWRRSVAGMPPRYGRGWTWTAAAPSSAC
jgi:hypothetical protein